MRSQELTYPITRRSRGHRLSLGIGVFGTSAVVQKYKNDPLLCFLGRVGARVALAGVLHGQMQRGGTAPILEQGISTTGKECLDRRDTSIPHRSMERRNATLVYGIWIRADVDEIPDHEVLNVEAPVFHSWPRICRIVERFLTPSIASANTSTLSDEQFGEVLLTRSGCDVKRSVSGIDVVQNSGEKICLGILPGRAHADRAQREVWCRIEKPRYLYVIANGNRIEDI